MNGKNLHKIRNRKIFSHKTEQENWPQNEQKKKNEPKQQNWYNGTMNKINLIVY